MKSENDRSGSPQNETLRYPFLTAPTHADGSAVKIAQGILWLRMPMSDGEGSINIWALRDGDGWTIVDTGIRNPRTVAAWRKARVTTLGGEPIHRTIVTHLHPDHSGMAGWLTSSAGAELWMTRLEFLMAQSIVQDTGREAPDEAVDFYRSAGWDEPDLDRYRTRFGDLGRYFYPLPRTFRRITAGDQIPIGDHVWEVVIGAGHSPEHACLYCRDLKLFISGDQVLPRISSNISVHPFDAEANPLAEWLTTLAEIRDHVDNDVLVLPAHGEPFHGLHERIGQLIGGHERGLERLSTALETASRPVDLFSAMFHRPITPELLGMATGETIAHLHYLRKQGRAKRQMDASGTAWWSSTSA